MEYFEVFIKIVEVICKIVSAINTGGLVEDSSSSVKNAKNIQLTKMKMKRKQPLLLQQERLKLIYMSNLL